MNPLRAFHGKPELKQRLLTEITAHAEADQIVKGTYGDGHNGDWKGCAVGCALHSLNRIEGKAPTYQTGDHQRLADSIGVPVEVVYLMDNMFENLDAPDYLTWPYRVIDAIPVGADCSLVIYEIMQWMILDPKLGWLSMAENDTERTVFRDFAALVKKDWIDDPDSVTYTEWIEMDHRLAWTRAGVWTRAREGAWTRAWTGARAGAYQDLAEQSLTVLRAAPVPSDTEGQDQEVSHG